MCGILLKTNQNSKEEFAEALALLKHRGPDQQNITEVHGQGVFLGHTRLSILDLSHLGSQPMNFKGSGLELIFNGEIYNYAYLKRKYNLQTISTGDTEVIFKLFQLKGPECFKELDGEFAIVIYDKKNKVIYAARDPMGIKPLYYWMGRNQEIILSSEIKPITKFTGRFFNQRAFPEFLTYGYLPGQETLFHGIKKVPPGTYLKYVQGRYSFHKFFELELPDEPVLQKADVIDVRNSITRAVKKRMISDVPISVTLSGGLDSSIIAAIMAENSKEVKSYSLGFSEDSEELEKTRIVANHLGTDHTEMVITPDMAFKEIDKILDSAEEPMDKGSLIPSYFIGRMIKEKVTLIGEGADECFAGYNRHKEIANWTTWTTWSNPKKRYFDEFIRVFPGDYYPPDLINKINFDSKNSVLLFDLLTEIPDYHNMRIDKMFMAFAVEARVPYLDPDVVRTALAVPYSAKTHPEKRILREAFWDKLPHDILWRKKSALKIPYDEWIEKQEVRETVLGSELFKQQEMLDLYAEPEESRNRGRKIWLAYLTTLWHSRNFS